MSATPSVVTGSGASYSSIVDAAGPQVGDRRVDVGDAPGDLGLGVGGADRARGDDELRAAAAAEDDPVPGPPAGAQARACRGRSQARVEVRESRIGNTGMVAEHGTLLSSASTSAARVVAAYARPVIRAKGTAAGQRPGTPPLQYDSWRGTRSPRRPSGPGSASTSCAGWSSWASSSRTRTDRFTPGDVRRVGMVRSLDRRGHPARRPGRRDPERHRSRSTSSTSPPTSASRRSAASRSRSSPSGPACRSSC